MLDVVSLSGVRNLYPCNFSLGSLNVFYGLNGSGKTSILEAIYLLSTGRSFRTSNVRKVIQDGQSICTVFARTNQGQQLGISKNIQGNQSLKRNGVMVSSMSEFASDLPMQLIHPENMDLIESGSKQRRQLLDWLLFYIEPKFYTHWLRYQRALAQRNALLKTETAENDAQWQVWELELSQQALLLHNMRVAVFDEWVVFIRSALVLLLPQITINVDYIAGFDVEQNLAAQLQENRFKDKQRGFTQIGAHRADLRFKTDMGLAELILSRGQKKLLICALKLAQVAFLRHRQKTCIVLLDDLASELDVNARERLLQSLVELQAQVLITTVEANSVWPLLQTLNNCAKLFHVEQGEILLQCG